MPLCTRAAIIITHISSSFLVQINSLVLNYQPCIFNWRNTAQCQYSANCTSYCQWCQNSLQHWNIFWNRNIFDNTCYYLAPANDSGFAVVLGKSCEFCKYFAIKPNCWLSVCQRREPGSFWCGQCLGWIVGDLTS